MDDQKTPGELPNNATEITESCSLFISDETDFPIVSIAGEVDLSSAPTAYSLLWQTSNEGSRSLIINLEELEFMDSSGLQALLRLREKLRARKQRVVLVGGKPPITKLFKLTGFDQLFAIFQSEQEAKDELKLSASSPAAPPQ